MALTVDNLATRYHLLPSEVMDRANTFDIYVMDLSAKWNKKQTEDANQKEGGVIKSGNPVKSKLSQEQMADLIKRAKDAA